MWILIDSSFVILALGAGVTSILLAMQMVSNYKFEYLNTFMYYQILLFIFGLYGVLGTIFVRNVLIEYEIPLAIIKNMAEFIPYIGVPVVLTAWFIFLKMSFEMVGKKMSQLAGFLYFGFILVSMFTYIIIIFIYFGKDSTGADELLSYSKYGFIGLEILTQFIAFFVLFRYGLYLKHKHNRILVVNFAIISLIVSVATTMVTMFSVPNTLVEKVYMLLFFAGQLPPVLYMAYYLNKYFSANHRLGSKQDNYDIFIANYQLSKREWEIIEQICKGHTNGQISDKLFISLQTVKDHVYHIYKKTGVKNRVQLVNMISTSVK